MNVSTLQPIARLLLSAGIVFGVLAAVAATSSAIFQSNPAKVAGSTFSTGSADLLIAPHAGTGPGTYSTSTPGATITDLIPGQQKNFDFWLKNAGQGDIELNLTGDVTNIVLTDKNNQTLTADATDLDTSLKILIKCDVMNTTLRDGASTVKDLATWNTDAPEALDETTVISANITPGRLAKNDGTNNGTGPDEAHCTMTATLENSSTANATSASFDAEFVGTQAQAS